MWEKYFVKPQTIDRIRASWIGPEVERYAAWLDEQGYRPRTVLRRVPELLAFGEFAQRRGAARAQDLPEHVEAFVQFRVSPNCVRPRLAKEIRGPLEQMLRVVLADFEGTGRPRHHLPFADTVPRFFGYLADERGLRPTTILAYRHYLSRLESFLAGVGASVSELSRRC